MAAKRKTTVSKRKVKRPTKPRPKLSRAARKKQPARKAATARRHAGEVCDAAFLPLPRATRAAPRARGPMRMGAAGASPLDSLGLVEVARNAAEILLAKHPELVITSGRRGSEDQARAMAGNVVRQRDWISVTYRDTTERRALQAWIDGNPQATTKAAVADGLLAVMASWTDAQKAKLSRHFSGNAFDIRPVAANAAGIKATIRGLPNLRKFLEREGDLVIWHVDFE